MNEGSETEPDNDECMYEMELGHGKPAALKTNRVDEGAATVPDEKGGVDENTERRARPSQVYKDGKRYQRR